MKDYLIHQPANRWEEFAAHEAGHAIAALALGVPVRSVYLEQHDYGLAGGCLLGMARVSTEDDAVITIAGPLAQQTATQYACPHRSWGDGEGSDWHLLHGPGGLLERLAEGDPAINATHYAYVRVLARGLELVRGHWEEIEMVAEALAERGKLTMSDLDELLCLI